MPAKGVIDFRTRARIAGHARAKMKQLEIETDAELARRLKVNRSTIGRMLKGQLPRIGLDLFIKLHRVLGIDATMMLGEDPKPPKGRGPENKPEGLKSSQTSPSSGGTITP